MTTESASLGLTVLLDAAPEMTKADTGLCRKGTGKGNQGAGSHPDGRDHVRAAPASPPPETQRCSALCQRCRELRQLREVTITNQVCAGAECLSEKGEAPRETHAPAGWVSTSSGTASGPAEAANSGTCRDRDRRRPHDARCSRPDTEGQILPNPPAQGTQNRPMQRDREQGAGVRRVDVGEGRGSYGLTGTELLFRKSKML